jgi:hypothetical protein
VVYDDYGTIGGGGGNRAGSDDDDTTNATYATVSGGRDNTAGGPYDTVVGGRNNTANSAGYATVVGGRDNTASGAYSFAAGRRAKANEWGCFVWGDSTHYADVSCNNTNRTIFRSSGGFYIYTKGDLSTGAYLAANSSTWSSVSDRNVKENIEAVDTRDVLERLAEVTISTWNYIGEEEGIRHMGPMAEDFYAAFGLGDSDRHISTVDADGVALAAIQGLYQLSQKQAARIEELEEENIALRQEVKGLKAENSAQQEQLEELEARVEALEQAVGASPSPQSGSPGDWLLGSSQGWWFVSGLLVAAVMMGQRRFLRGRR